MRHVANQSEDKSAKEVQKMGCTALVIQETSSKIILITLLYIKVVVLIDSIVDFVFNFKIDCKIDGYFVNLIKSMVNFVHTFQP